MPRAHIFAESQSADARQRRPFVESHGQSSRQRKPPRCTSLLPRVIYGALDKMKALSILDLCQGLEKESSWQRNDAWQSPDTVKITHTVKSLPRAPFQGSRQRPLCRERNPDSRQRISFFYSMPSKLFLLYIYNMWYPMLNYGKFSAIICYI